MKTVSKIIFVLLIAMALSMSSCATSSFVRFTVNVPDATIILDGKRLKNAEEGIKLSNAIWEDPSVLVQAPGQNDYRGSLKKEVKVGNAVIGYLLFWPSLLWCYGPAPEQYFYLSPKQ